MTKEQTALWHEFYQTATRFRDLKPWIWCADSDLFGVQNPETGEIGWCCIMGQAGEHFALAVYRGAAGLESYYNLFDSVEMEDENPEMMNIRLRQDCWMIAFENADMVSREQKQLLKDLKLSFRGAGQWIVAESYDPGLAPWPIAEKDLPFLMQCLEQAMEVALRYKDDPGLLEQEAWLVRTPARGQDGGWVWRDVFVDEDELPEPERAPAILPSAGFLKTVKALPELKGALAVGSFLILSNIQENKSVRPWHPMLLLAIDPGSGMIVAQDMITYASLPKAIEPFLSNVFKNIPGKTSQLLVHHPPLARLLENLCAQADIELIELDGNQPFYTEVVASLSEMGFF